MKLPKISPKWIRRRREHPTVGIDIGSHTIKLVEFGSFRGRRTVRKVGRARLPQDAIVEGNVRDMVAIADTLRALVSNLQPKRKRATLSIAGYSVIAKRISVPYVDEKEIELNLLEEAENHVPFEVDDLYIDFHVIGPSEERETATDIFLAAAKREVVDSFANIIQDAGLMPAVVDVDGYALVNSFFDLYSSEDEEVLLLDIGARKTVLTVVAGGHSLFTREMSFGGVLVTEAIQEATGFSGIEAERVKVEGTDDKGLAREIAEICGEICTLWAEEVNQVVDYYSSSMNVEKRPATLYLSGGGSLFNGLESLFSRELGTRVLRFNPLSERRLDPKVDKEYVDLIGPQFAIASGLALRTG